MLMNFNGCLLAADGDSLPALTHFFKILDETVLSSNLRILLLPIIALYVSILPTPNRTVLLYVLLYGINVLIYRANPFIGY